MIRKVLAAIALVVILLLCITAVQPDQFRVSRSTDIQAPPEKIYALVDDLAKFQTWSPWAKKDPNMQLTLSGPAMGKGAAMSWSGNDAVGVGTMTITDSQPPQKIALALDFQEPFAASNTADFTFASKGPVTTVTWSMQGPANFVTKLMGLFVSMDAMVGPDFEAGLANLKAAAEAP